MASSGFGRCRVVWMPGANAATHSSPSRSFFPGLSERDGDEWVGAFAPGIQTTQQRPNPLDAILPEEQRHTGAGGFVWSSTVEDYFAVARQPVVLLFQLLGVHAERAGNGFRIGFEFHRVAQVDNDEFFARVEVLFEFVHRNARDAQLAQQAPAAEKLIGEMACGGPQEKGPQTRARGRYALGSP